MEKKITIKESLYLDLVNAICESHDLDLCDGDGCQVCETITKANDVIFNKLCA